MITVITAGIAPGLALLSYFYLKDQYNQEPPIAFVTKSFVLGALLVFPIMFIQYAFLAEGFFRTDWQHAYLLSALLEEFFKWFLLFYSVYLHFEFEGHYEGIVYGVAISLGFATVENVLYLLEYGVNLAFSRALLPVSSHALFGVVMGYYLGKAKTSKPEYKRRLLAVSLSLPILIHGTYDYILLSFERYWPVFITIFMLLLWWNALRKVKKANQPHDPVWVAPADSSRRLLKTDKG